MKSKTNYGIVVDPRDEKYLLSTPETGFSPEHNQMVIERSIRKADALRAKKWAEWDEATRERASALFSYFKHIENGNSSPTEKYFGRKYLSHLRGQEIVENLQNHYTTINRQGQIIRHMK